MPIADDILHGLNEQQRAAVTAPEGPVLVLAGPGSGKTRVLTHRIAWLIGERSVPAWRIMAMTFTNKAAREMARRVQEMLSESAKGLTMGTFHSICARILRREAEQHLPISRDYVIFDTGDQRALMKSVITDDLGLDEKRYSPDKLLNRISNAKNELVTPAEYRTASYIDEVTKRAYERYQQRLATYNAVDFDDLLMHVALLVMNNPSVRARYQNSFDHILVDEFQDTNGAQYAIVRELAANHHHLFCVGDEDQSIYRWRGADYRNLARLRTDFPEVNVLLLEQNYRSTQVILDAARAVIDRNAHRTPKHLFTEQGRGPEIVIYEAHDEQFEAQFVVETIAQLVATREIEPGGVAVMYRTNAQSRVLEEAFMRAALPYRLVGATRFYTRREIKDVIAYLRVIHNADDTVSLRRIINTPTRGIGNKTLESLELWAAAEGVTPGAALLRLADDPDTGPFDGRTRSALAGFARLLAGWRRVRETQTVTDLLRVVLDETRYLATLDDGTDQGIDRRENVLELLNVASEFEELPLSAFLEEVALVSDVDDLTEEVNAPTLLTLHAAKGLEFDAVFLVGLEEGILPHDRSIDDAEQMAEERRLLYVGMTRARKYMFLVYAFRRTQWGSSDLKLRSRFLDDIPEELLVPAHAMTFNEPSIGVRRRGMPPRVRRRDEGNGGAFHVGQRVKHPKFGEGMVIDTRPSGSDQEVSVVFESVGPKRLLASFANLTVIAE